MDKYGKFLHNAQAVYFTDTIRKIYPKAKIGKIDTYWESLQVLPFHINAQITVNQTDYFATMEYRSWSVKGYDTHYGMVVLDLISTDAVTPGAREKDIHLIVNPATLESELISSDNEDFFRDLAYWAENFKSNKYPDRPPTGDIKDAVITYYQNKKRESA